VLVTTYAGDESRCSVLRSLQTANDDISDTVQRSITVRSLTLYGSQPCKELTAQGDTERLNYERQWSLSPRPHVLTAASVSQ